MTSFQNSILRTVDSSVGLIWWVAKEKMDVQRVCFYEMNYLTQNLLMDYWQEAKNEESKLQSANFFFDSFGKKILLAFSQYKKEISNSLSLIEYHGKKNEEEGKKILLLTENLSYAESMELKEMLQKVVNGFEILFLKY